jgi:myo-inositol-1(or 4)-monophosphatase
MNTKLTQKELVKLRDFALQISFEAGRKLVRFQKEITKLKVTAKEAQGVVSRADIETERYIIDQIQKRYPEHYVLGEESSFKQMSTMAQYKNEVEAHEFSWIIDPLDGTTNFLTGLDYFAVCIALYYKGEVILGVVHRPQTDETYSSAKGSGAWKYKNSKRSRLRGPDRRALADSVLATGFSSEKGKLINQEFRIFRKMMDRSRGIRRMGSAALDMCLVAEGLFNGFWERGLAPWDIAASGIICQEAGVQVSDWKGQPFSPFIKTIQGCESSLVKEFSQLLV